MHAHCLPASQPKERGIPLTSNNLWTPHSILVPSEVENFGVGVENVVGSSKVASYAAVV